MPTKSRNITKYNQGEKSIKLPFVVYADLECLLENMSMHHLLLKLINIHHLVIHYLLIVHLIKLKIN